MTAYLSHLQAEAHAEDLRDEPRRPRADRTRHPRPGRLRHSTALVLLRLATRLDHGLRPTTVH
jgi:hypothetical protein